MTLASLLASYDDAALTAVASKGVVIRATKDVGAGRVSVQTQDTESATLDVAGEAVSLSAKSLEASRCPCPATGICRHIVAAVLFLRDQSDTVPKAGTESAPAEKPRIFDVDEIEKFAGADWALACAWAEQGIVPDGTGSIVVTFADHDAKVTFPAGRGLRDAVYKGPVAAHKRRAIAAAALALGQANGVDLPEVIAASTRPAVDMDTLDRSATALEEAVMSLAAGTFAQAQGTLFNLAISTRAEAIPRLASELRGLSQRMSPEAIRTSSVTPVDLLGSIARLYALVDALRVAPDDPALVGIIARSFEPAGPKTVVFLGGETWTTPAGAKGLTLVFCDAETGSIHRATQARAAGTDLTFDPSRQWRSTLWGVAAPHRMIGRRVHFDDAALAGDGGLGLTQKASLGDAIGFDDLQLVQTDWQAAAQTAALQMGLGLRRKPGDAMLVLAPSDIGALSFDPYAQTAVWDWYDAAGRTLTLALPHGQVIAQNLVALTRRIKGGLVALPAGGGPGRLISVWIDGPEPGPLSLGLDVLPKPKGIGAMMDRLIERTTTRQQSAIAPLDPLALYFERASEAVLASLPIQAGLPENLVSDAQALGLGQILAANQRWQDRKGQGDALRLAYLLGSARDMARGRVD